MGEEGITEAGGEIAVSTKRWKKWMGGDRLLLLFSFLIATLIPILVGGMFVFLIYHSRLTIRRFGWQFLTGTTWDPIFDKFGALPFIYGTVVSTTIALLISVPFALGVAIFTAELAPKWLRTPVILLSELLAAIPSVVYGLWGIFVLVPLVRSHIGPFLQKFLGFLPLFQGYPFGVVL
ncbi:MAG: PstC family ABC transporter permease, partial [bacterium]